MRKRQFTPSKKRIRNLIQYKDLDDAEFEKIFEEKFSTNIDDDESFDDLNLRVDAKRKELEKDYDFEDMKANDMMQLEAFILATLQLEDIEKEVYIRRGAIDNENILVLEKLNRILSGLRADISTLSNDLQLTKRVRTQNKDVTIAQKWEELSKKAASFFKQKMLYVFCPSCRMLLSTIWLQYPDLPNEITLFCSRCDDHYTIELPILYSTGNKNLKDAIIP